MALLQTVPFFEPTPPPVAVGMCPLCHTVETAVTAETLQAGDTWRCATCGQVWSARRLETVAAYARYVATH